MGGWGSGRSTGRPVREEGKVIDLAKMLRMGWIAVGCQGWGQQLRWTRGGEPAGSITYDYNLIDPDAAILTLRYRTRQGGEWFDRMQHIRLVHTRPSFGGRRWWMVCPVNGDRIGRLYLPNGGDIFAGRKAWRIAYRSQRVSRRDQAFERLFRLQDKLGGPQGWGEPIFRPKGMWQRTWDRLEARYFELDAICSVEMMAALKLIGRE